MNQKIKDDYKFVISKDFDQRAEEYYRLRQNSHSFNAQTKLVLKMLDGIEGTILDVGCGPANIEPKLLKLGFIAYGLDISMKMIASAMQRGDYKKFDRRLHFLVGDSEWLPYAGSAFNAVISLGTLEYLHTYQNFLKEANRVLKPNGTLLVTLPRKWAPNQLLEYPIKRTYRFLTKIIPMRGKSRPKEESHSYRTNKVVVSLFEHQLEQNGFRRIYSCCCNFAVIPTPIDRHVPNLSSWLSSILEPLCSLRIFGWFGSQWVVKAVKIR